MAGHSKWNNIKQKKGKTDAQRGKIFTKISREITVSVKEGGGDPASNARLRDVIAKARALNVPNENIRRVIEKAAVGNSAATYESNIYEGYGPAGAAVIVETMTDNKNRTAADMRHYFDKYGGNLGTEGCVAWSFDTRGVLVIDKDTGDEDTVLLDALDAGAADVVSETDVFIVYTAPEEFGAVRMALEKKDYSFLSAQVEMIPQNYIKLSEDDKPKMQKLLSLLDDHDDIQNVWHNVQETE